MDIRLNALTRWLNSAIKQSIISIEPASEDASFRRYFRVFTQANDGDANPPTLIAMDAPPEHEDNPLFIQCATTLSMCGINAPKIFESNLAQGFLLVSDLGVNTYQNALKTHSVETLYRDAIDALLKLQLGTQQHGTKYPAYNEGKLVPEMELFEQWYVQKHLQTSLNLTQKKELTKVFSILVDNALKQPQTLVHRDYHCRNLLVTDGNNPGVIDFQDMVVGAVTYDLVSLLKDCYVEWPEPFIDSMLMYYLQQAYKAKLFNTDINFQTLKRWFDFMGVQRHLKVLGIFARLHHRDNKPQYLGDLPLVKKHVINTCKTYAELRPLHKLILDLQTHAIL